MASLTRVHDLTSAVSKRTICNVLGRSRSPACLAIDLKAASHQFGRGGDR